MVKNSKYIYIQSSKVSYSYNGFVSVIEKHAWTCIKWYPTNGTALVQLREAIAPQIVILQTVQ